MVDIWLMGGELFGFVVFWLFGFFVLRIDRGEFGEDRGEEWVFWGGRGGEWGVILIFVVEVICLGVGICIVYFCGVIFWNFISLGLMV